MERPTTPCPSPQLITVSYFKSLRRVNNNDVMRITICCYVDYYDRKLSQWLQSYVHGNVHFSVFRSFTVCGEQVFHVLLIFSDINKYGGLQE